MDDSTQRRRVTYAQLEVMWEFLNSNKEIAFGYNKSAQARHYSKRLWLSVAEALNSHGTGAVKNWKGWSNYWVDYKAKLKKKVVATRGLHNETRGPTDVAPITSLEIKYLSLLGDGFGTGPNIQDNPFPTSTEVNIPLDPEPSTAEQDRFNPQPSTSGCVLSTPPTRKSRRPVRRRRTPILTQAARRSLIDINQARLELERKNSETLQQMLITLNKIASSIKRLFLGD